MGIPSGRVHLQGLGVEPGECTGGNRSFARYAWGSRSDEVVVGHLANKSAEKGTVDLLAAEYAWSRGRRFRVALADRRCRTSGNSGGRSVPRLTSRDWGHFPISKSRDFFAGIDFHALPSRCDSFGLVLLEAWINGKPNVAYAPAGPAN